MKEIFSRRSGRLRRATPSSDGPTPPRSSTPRPPPEPFPSGIKLLHNPSEDALVDIVFVHGLTGHREDTWTATPDATEPWPKTLLPAKISNARVLTFGYDASVVDLRSVVSESRVGNHAQNLLNALANFREEDNTNERPLIFVCHSLGGLVCEDALVSSWQNPEEHLKAILIATKGVVFLGTPHRGAGLSHWAEKLSMAVGAVKQTNTDILRVLRRDSEVLARIQNDFHKMIKAMRDEGKEAIKITCFYEELPIKTIGLVVPQDSAILPGYISIGIRKNHREMTKFASVEDAGFIAVCAELRRWTKGMRTPSMIQAAAEHESSKIRESELSQVHFIVPCNENPDFIGRDQVLDKLKRDFKHDVQRYEGKGRSRMSLYGLGGIGKTQIALAYAYWLRDVRPDMSIFWVHASSLERFEQAFTRIAQECNIPDHQNPSVDILSLVHSWLLRNTQAPWLIVIDNADDTHLFFPDTHERARINNADMHEGTTRALGRFIPECSHGSVLITTRNKQAAQRLAPGRPPVAVPKMNEEESAHMIRIMTGDEELSLENASLLSDQLEHLPLAIAQASAYIQENSISINRYQKVLEQSDKDVVRLLSEEFETVGRDFAIPHAVMLTWVVSFEQIEKRCPLASEVLSLVAFFDRQAIPEKLLTKHFRQLYNDEIRICRVKRNAYDSTTTMELENDNVDDNIHIEGVNEAETEKKRMLGLNTPGDKAVLAGHGPLATVEIDTKDNTCPVVDTEPCKQPLAGPLTVTTDSEVKAKAICSTPRLEAGLTHNNSHAPGTKFKPDRSSHKHKVKTCRMTYSYAEGSQCGYEEDENQRERAADFARSFIHPEGWKRDDLYRIPAEDQIARIKAWFNSQQFEIIQSENRRRLDDPYGSFSLESHTPGDEQRDPITRGEIRDAINIIKGFSILSEGKEERYEIHRLVRLATKTWLKRKGLHTYFAEMALRTLRKAFPTGVYENMDVCKSYLPHAHAVLENETSDTHTYAVAKAELLRDLSSFYVNTGQLGIAAKLSDLNLKTAKPSLGDKHYVLLKVMRRLAEIFYYLGESERSNELISILETLQHQVFPSDHPELLHTKQILARKLRSEGNLGEAHELLRLALSQCNSHTDNQKYFSIRIKLMLELSRNMIDMNNLQEAASFCLQTEDALKVTFGSEHPLALRNYRALAEIYKQEHKLEKAADICRQALHGRDIAHDHAQVFLLDIKALLGLILHDQGHLQEAGEVQSQTLGIATVLYERDPLRISRFAIDLIATREAQGLAEEAEELRARVIDNTTS